MLMAGLPAHRSLSCFDLPESYDPVAHPHQNEEKQNSLFTVAGTAVD